MMIFILECISVILVIVYYSVGLYITFRNDALKDRVVRYAFNKYREEKAYWVTKKIKKIGCWFNRNFLWWFREKDIVVIEYPEIEMNIYDNEQLFSDEVVQRLTRLSESSNTDDDTYDIIKYKEEDSDEEEWTHITT